MSTYGTAIVIDVPDNATRDIAVELLQSADITTDGVAPRGDLYETSAPDGWRRVTAYVYQPGLFEQFPFALPRLGTARVASAEDFDADGALWVVAAIENGSMRTVHRRWVLNADPSDPEQTAAAIAAQGEDPRRHSPLTTRRRRASGGGAKAADQSVGVPISACCRWRPKRPQVRSS